MRDCGMNGGGGHVSAEREQVTLEGLSHELSAKIPSLKSDKLGAASDSLRASHSPSSSQTSPSSSQPQQHPECREASLASNDEESRGRMNDSRASINYNGSTGDKRKAAAEGEHEEKGGERREHSSFADTSAYEQRSSGEGELDCYHADCGTDRDGDGDDSSNPSNDPGKMFIGGLSWQTTAEGLRDYFNKYGEVNECMVMRDPATKRARGFGFITFVDPSSVDKVLLEENHELDGKKIDPKIAFPKRPQPKMVIKTKKVFIGGLSSNSTLEDMKAYFHQFGKIEDAMLMYDKATQRHRGFGFITFDDDSVSDRVCEIHFHEINGKMVECKKAQPKEVMLPVQINKSRAAAARNFYGLAPEQLLAFASFMPRMPATSPYQAATAAGLPAFYSGVFNGLGTPTHPQPTFCLSPSGRSSVSNTNNGAATLSSGGSSLLRYPPTLFDVNTVQQVQLAAQQQAMFEATSAYAYANAMAAAEQFSPTQFHQHAASTSGGAGIHQHHHFTQQQQLHHLMHQPAQQVQQHMVSPQQHQLQQAPHHPSNANSSLQHRQQAVPGHIQPHQQQSQQSANVFGSAIAGGGGKL